jgi:isoleucyl-tRNA synthetase
MQRLERDGRLSITLDGEALTLSRDELEARMHESKGFAAEGSGGEFAILETTLSPELVLEGQARELVHQIQNLRRDAGLAVDDRIVVVHDGSLEPLLKAHRAYIARETLAIEVAKDEKLASLHNLRVAELRLDGEKVRVGIRPAGKN